MTTFKRVIAGRLLLPAGVCASQLLYLGCFLTRDLDKVSDQKELNFALSPFLSRQVPSSLKVNADLMRKALDGSTVTTGYKVTLDRLKIRSILAVGDTLLVDLGADLSVK